MPRHPEPTTAWRWGRPSSVSGKRVTESVNERSARSARLGTGPADVTRRSGSRCHSRGTGSRTGRPRGHHTAADPAPVPPATAHGPADGACLLQLAVQDAVLVLGDALGSSSPRPLSSSWSRVVPRPVGGQTRASPVGRNVGRVAPGSSKAPPDTDGRGVEPGGPAAGPDRRKEDMDRRVAGSRGTTV